MKTQMLVLSLLLALHASGAAAQDLDQLLDRYLDARGVALGDDRFTMPSDEGTSR